MSKETKICPHCGGEILAVAKKCKHCGEWLTEEPKPINTEAPKAKNSKGWLWAVAVAVLCAIVGVVTIISKSEDSATNDPELTAEQLAFKNEVAAMLDDVYGHLDKVISTTEYEEKYCAPRYLELYQKLHEFRANGYYVPYNLRENHWTMRRPATDEARYYFSELADDMKEFTDSKAKITIELTQLGWSQPIIFYLAKIDGKWKVYDIHGSGRSYCDAMTEGLFGKSIQTVSDEDFVPSPEASAIELNEGMKCKKLAEVYNLGCWRAYTYDNGNGYTEIEVYFCQNEQVGARTNAKLIKSLNGEKCVGLTEAGKQYLLHNVFEGITEAGNREFFIDMMPEYFTDAAIITEIEGD